MSRVPHRCRPPHPPQGPHEISLRSERVRSTCTVGAMTPGRALTSTGKKSGHLMFVNLTIAIHSFCAISRISILVKILTWLRLIFASHPHHPS